MYSYPEIAVTTDKEGLDKAYGRAEQVYVNGDTLYVAGTSNKQDAWDDLKIPTEKTSWAQRYKDANALLAKNPQVSNLVGHSLGGSAVLEFQKNHGEKTFKTNTYGAPVASLTAPDNKESHRYRNYGDPVSLFDRGADSNIKPSAHEHYMKGRTNPGEIWEGILDANSYDNFEKNNVSDQTYHFQQMF
jgi:hypothetical protein